MSKFKYFNVAKPKFPGKFLHVYDLILFAVLMAGVMILAPTVVDFSVPFNTSSDSQIQGQIARLEEPLLEGTVKSSDFLDLFKSSLFFDGYGVNIGYDPYLYREGEAGTGYYQMEDGALQKRRPILGNESPRGLILQNLCISVLEDGQIYVDDLKGVNGPLEHWVDLDAPLDIPGVMKVLNGTGSYLDLAQIMVLVRQGTLVGFYDYTGWFHITEGQNHRFIKATGLSHEEVFTLEGDISRMMVIKNDYLVYAKDGNLHIYCIETGDEACVPFDEWTDLGQLQQISYLCAPPASGSTPGTAR